MKELERESMLASCWDGHAHQTKMVALITNMNQPLGVKVGNSLEIEESIDILKGVGPKDTTDLTVELGAYMLVLAKLAPDVDSARALLSDKIADGSALAKLGELITAQGGDANVLEHYDLLPHAKNQITIAATEDGYVESIDANALGMLVVYLGAVAEKKLSARPGVGLEILKKIWWLCHRGEPLVVIHATILMMTTERKCAPRIQTFDHQATEEELIYELMKNDSHVN